MTIADKELIETFCLEIIANSKKTFRDCLKVSTHNFPSKSSTKIINILSTLSLFIEESTKFIYKEIDWRSTNHINSSFVMLRDLKTLIQDLSKDLEYIESSKMSKVPAGLSAPLQKISQNIESNVEILLLQQWVYNYSINTKNKIQRYREITEMLSPYVSNELSNKIESFLQNPVYSIYFPSLEKNNILLYSVLGHEIGHLVADKNYEKFKEKFFDTNNTGNELFSLYKNYSKDLTRPKFLRYIEIITKRLYDELLSDVVGAIIFGPAMLFSMYEFSQQFDLDNIPSGRNRFYPSWRARLRIIYNTIIKYIPSFQSCNKQSQEHLYFDVNIQNRLERIENIINEKSDETKIKHSEELIFKIYSQVIFVIEHHLINDLLIELDRSNLEENSFFNRINLLSARLENGIPPNTINDLDIKSSAKLYEIINAAWKNRLSWEPKIFDENGNFDEKYLVERKKLNQLTLKAIEYANLSKEYNNFIEGA